MRFKTTELAKPRAAQWLRASLQLLLCLCAAGAAQAAPASNRLHAAWRAAITSTPLPAKGCFSAEYPATVWKQVACTQPPNRAYEPARGSGVGFGNDYAAEISGSISSAVGSFPAITGLTSEKSAGASNQYSLQMNVPYFSSPACKTSPYPPGCAAWQQFVFSQSAGKNATSSAFMVYWLINFGAYCPSGWTQEALNCFINSTAVAVPHQKLTAIAALQLSGAAAAGGNDTVKITTAKKAYAVSAPDSALDLAGSWTGTEFNITAMMGVVMIVGIATEMAIFFASEYQALERTLPAREALHNAALNRLRPILMSTLAMILALLPLGVAISGSGDQMLQPLAIATIAGIIVQLPLVLLAMPVVVGLTVRRKGSAPRTDTAPGS